MKTALVVDWLDLYGGAERVITVLSECFDIDEVWCMIDVMNEKDKERLFHKKYTINTTSLQKVGRKFRFLFPIFPFFMRQIRVREETDLILTSSHTVAKGVKKTSPSQFHVCYIQQRNLMYVWEPYERKLFFKQFSKFIGPILYFIKRNDFKSAQKPDLLIANSKFVQNWLLQTYNRDSQLVYPPVDINKFKLVEKKEEYYVTVGRFAIKKRFDLIINAFNKLGKKLIVIGDGELKAELQSIANSNIEFTGFLSSDEISEIIGRAKGFVFAALEDFGIAPVESQACGTPVICFGQGGTAETVIHGETGFLFDRQDVDSIVDAVMAFEQLSFDAQVIRANAERFSEARFKKEISEIVKKAFK